MGIKYISNYLKNILKAVPCALGLQAVSSADRVALDSVDGQMVYDTDLKKGMIYQNGNWAQVSNPAAFSGAVSAASCALSGALTALKAVLSAGSGTGTFSASGVLNVQPTTIATIANHTETTGHTYTLPASSLAANGESVRVKAWGTCAANTNNKRVRLYFGGTAIYDSGAVAVNNKSWSVEALITRVSSGNQRCLISGSFNAAPISTSVVTDLTKTDTATQIIKTTMLNDSADAAGDLTAEGFIVEFLP